MGSDATDRSDCDRCWAEVDLAAVRRNAVRMSAAAGGQPLVAVVKADAYGHGLAPVARALDPLDCIAFLGVAAVSEASALAVAGVQTRRLILFPVSPGERADVLRSGATPVIASLDEAHAYDALAGAAENLLDVHLGVDTGMGRNGFLENEAADAADAVAALTNLRLDGICSHFPSADCDPGFTRDQIGRFSGILDEIELRGHRVAWRHLANGPGILGFPPPAGCNLARCGLALYGESPLPGANDALGLEPALSLQARITLVRELPAGHGVSYGRTFVTGHPTRVATVACGYADGYPRHLSGQGAAILVRGQRCPVLGRVTMDLVMADVSDLDPAPKPGDVAVLLGRSGDDSVSASELADRAGTIPWEVFTRISPRVERRFLAE